MRINARTAFVGAGLYTGGVYMAYQYIVQNAEEQKALNSASAATGSSCVCVAEAERREAFNVGAPKYDDEIGTDEFFMGLPLLRRMLLWDAVGDTIEVATGTGRNFKYYDFDRVGSLTACDCSAEMIVVAQEKAAKLELPEQQVHCVTMDAGTLQFPDDTFDTVVDTFGLCSFEDPAAVLAEMQRICKPNGQVLLLEHGRSHYDWLTDILDTHAVRHAKRWGCWWNRDIEKIVADSRLDVVSTSKFHFGTTSLIKGKPFKPKKGPFGDAIAIPIAEL